MHSYNFQNVANTLFVTFNNYNAGMSCLPDIYTRSPRAEGGHISQAMSDCVTTTYYVTLSQSEFSCNCICNVVCWF